MATTLLLGQLEQIFVWVFIGVIFFVLFISFLAFWSLGNPWFQAYMSGHGISFFQIVGMKHRKVDIKQVISQGITASQAGFPIKWIELESAYLQGVDIERVVTAYIVSSKRGDEFTFEDIVNADRESRLQDMLDH